MINISNIKKTFYSALGEEKAVFNGLNLEINQGDFISVIGSNGAGKTMPVLKYSCFVFVTAAGLGEAESSSARDIFAAMRTHEVLLHHPYDSFSTSVQE